jgi:hypothetical protein
MPEREAVENKHSHLKMSIDTALSIEAELDPGQNLLEYIQERMPTCIMKHAVAALVLSCFILSVNTTNFYNCTLIQVVFFVY